MIFYVSENVYPKLFEKLVQYGQIQLIKADNSLNYPESRHADLHYYVDGNYIYKRQSYNKNYPECAETCAVHCGDVLIHNYKCTPDEILKKYSKFINVKQGYTRCNACYLDSINTIITGNKEISEKANQNGIKSVLIDDSSVKLEGYDRGFIGGAMGYSKNLNTLFVNGSLSSDFPELYNKISENVKIIECEGAVVDIGSILISE